MNHTKFRAILKKYMRGEATSEERTLIDSWYRNMGKDFPSNIDEVDDSITEERYWSAIEPHIRYGNNTTKRQWMHRWQSIGIAASVVIALTALLYTLQGGRAGGDQIRGQPISDAKEIQITNNGVAVKVITLPDRSRVALQPQSKLTFDDGLTERERVVFLDGEAFFEIERDVTRPFVVYTKNVATKVLGTSFTVKAFQRDKNVIVEVKTGKVSVYAYQEEKANLAKTDAVILTPNQKIVYDKEENTLSRMIVAAPQAILPPEELKRMRFEAAPVREIFQAIEKVYGVDLVYDEDSIASCTLTTSISDGDLFNRMDIICYAIGAHYEVDGDKVLIKNASCNSQ
jgi:transmembrane sensor